MTPPYRSPRLQILVRSCLGLLFCLLLSLKAAAQYTYIVPVAGQAVGFRSQYGTKISALNPNATSATLRYEAFYPASGDNSCLLPDFIQVIPPKTMAGLGQACFFLHALVLTSDQPLLVMADIYSITDPIGRDLLFRLQPVEVATSWIAPGVESTIPNVIMVDPSDKANIVIVNPNDFILTVAMHVARAELEESADVTLTVPARSVLMTAVKAFPTPVIPSGTLRSYDGLHQITLRANGKLSAGVSNEFYGSQVFRGAVPLQH